MKQVKVLTTYCQFIRNIWLMFSSIAHVYRLSPCEPVTFRVDSSSLSASVNIASRKCDFLHFGCRFRVQFLVFLSAFQSKPAWVRIPRGRTLEEENSPLLIEKIPYCRREDVGGPAAAIPMECQSPPLQYRQTITPGL